MLTKKSHIVFMLPIYLPANLSGSEMVVKDLAETLAADGYHVSVITSNARTARYWYDPVFGTRVAASYEVIHGVRIHRMRCNQVAATGIFIFNQILQRIPVFKVLFKKLADHIELFSWGPVLMNLDAMVKRLHPDYVVVSPFPARICLRGKMICEKLRVPYAVIPFFKKEQHLFDNHLLGEILDSAAVICAPTATEKQYISRYTHNRTIVLLPSSIDGRYVRTNRRAIAERATDICESYRLTGKHIVLFVGNKGEGKGITEAAEAVKKMERKDAVFVAVGNSTRHWDAYIKQNMHPGIVSLPYQTGIDKYAWYDCADVLVLPSVTDNFPLVFLEAWQFKKPVIAYDFYTMRELLTDGSGFLVPTHDIDALSKTIGRVIDNPARARAAGEIGYNKVHLYSRERITKKLFLPALRRIRYVE